MSYESWTNLINYLTHTQLNNDTDVRVTSKEERRPLTPRPQFSSFTSQRAVEDEGRGEAEGRGGERGGERRRHTDALTRQISPEHSKSLLGSVVCLCAYICRRSRVCGLTIRNPEVREEIGGFTSRQQSPENITAGTIRQHNVKERVRRRRGRRGGGEGEGEGEDWGLEEILRGGLKGNGGKMAPPPDKAQSALIGQLAPSIMIVIINGLQEENAVCLQLACGSGADQEKPDNLLIDVLVNDVLMDRETDEEEEEKEEEEEEEEEDQEAS
ncbi:unnamed protein product [Pleuronectes platessa]|uniref:Uncharacterized protein n=1 Tax=Pleuronectes platessa TaxID=8262 RepID=A0A9N7VV87_PLEPL|nr:unnamed protein product [Pleuronectes platessa]